MFGAWEPAGRLEENSSGSAHGDRGRWSCPADAPDQVPAVWRKSSWSNFNGNCVEVASFANDLVGVRDTKDRGSGPTLTFDGADWRNFIADLKGGSPGC